MMAAKLVPYLIIAKDGGPGSISTHTTALARALALAGHPLTVLTTRPDQLDRTLADLPVKILAQPLADNDPARRLYRQWSDALHPLAGPRAILPRSFGGVSSLAMLLAIRRHFRRLYTIEHSVPEHMSRLIPHAPMIERRGPLRLARNHLAARLVTRSLAVSEAVRQRMLDRFNYPPDRVRTCWNWVDDQRYHPDDAQRASMRSLLNAAPGQWLLGYVGRLSPEKRLDLLIRGFADFRRQSGRDARLILVGKGPSEASLLKLTHELDLAAHVHFALWQPDPAPWHRALDVMVLPSEFEGLPLTVLEAMSSGTVVLTNIVGGTPECVTDGRDGFIAHLHGPSDITAQLLRIAALPTDSLAAVRRAARQRVLDHFSLKQALPRLLEGLDSPQAAALVREGRFTPPPHG